MDRLLLVGFGGIDVTELDLGMREGWLPTMATLAETSHRVHLGGDQDVMVGSSWTTLLTGTLPPEHMIMETAQYDPTTGQLRPVIPADAQEPPLWADLAHAGRTPLVLSLHSGGTVPGLPGTQIAGWGQYDPWITGKVGPHAEPPEAIRWLEARAPRPDLAPFVDQPRTPAGILDAVGAVHEAIDGFGKASRELLDRHGWDLYFTQFGQAHEWGHRLWDLADGVGRDRLRELCRHVDDEIRRLLEAVPTGTTVGVYTPYGMTSNTNVSRALPALLELAGLTHRRTITAAPDVRMRTLQLGRQTVRRLIPPALRPGLARLVPRDRWHVELYFADIDWSRSRAIVVPNDSSGHIRLLVRGRDPNGTVEPGAAYDRLCDEVVELLRGVRDADTGEPLAGRVERTDRLYGSEVTGPLPDVVSGWRSGPPVRAITVDGVGTVDVPPTSFRSGIHRAPGWLLLSGPDLAPATADITDASLVDLAPTVLELLDVPIPDRFPGRSLVGEMT